jgi:hypothetical protein
MAKSSSTNKVARMARSGGTVRERPKLGFPVAVVAIVLLGSLLVVFARGERDTAVAQPPVVGDHWHNAFGVYVCDSWLPPLDDADDDEQGIHSHGDGLIHVHPLSEDVAGEGATFGVFAEQVGITFDGDSFTMPDGETYGPGTDCDGQPAVVELVRWDTPGAEEPSDVITSDFAAARILGDQQVLALAVVPEGTDVPQPDTTANLANPDETEPGSAPSTETAPGVAPAGEPSDATPPTSAGAVPGDGPGSDAAAGGASTDANTP